MSRVSVASFYRFAAFDDFRDWQAPLRALCAERGVKGTILLAPEGVNGTLAGARTDLESIFERLAQDPRFARIEPRWALADEAPFGRLRVRLKKEIVTMKVPGLDPRNGVGEYVEPREWNELILDPEVLVVDTRNGFEVEAGTFAGAINPDTGSFGEFPEWADRNLDSHRRRKVAMFCTGGIRCEKATAYLVSRGFEAVYHLKGGILAYLEQVPASESLWRGACFVFDERGTVTPPTE